MISKVSKWCFLQPISWRKSLHNIAALLTKRWDWQVRFKKWHGFKRKILTEDDCGILENSKHFRRQQKSTEGALVPVLTQWQRWLAGFLKWMCLLCKHMLSLSVAHGQSNLLQLLGPCIRFTSDSKLKLWKVNKILESHQKLGEGIKNKKKQLNLAPLMLKQPTRVVVIFPYTYTVPYVQEVLSFVLYTPSNRLIYYDIRRK